MIFELRIVFVYFQQQQLGFQRFSGALTAI